MAWASTQFKMSPDSIMLASFLSSVASWSSRAVLSSAVAADAQGATDREVGPNPEVPGRVSRQCELVGVMDGEGLDSHQSSERMSRISNGLAMFRLIVREWCTPEPNPRPPSETERRALLFCSWFKSFGRFRGHPPDQEDNKKRWVLQGQLVAIGHRSPRAG